MIFIVLVLLWLWLAVVTVRSPLVWWLKASVAVSVAVFTFFVAHALGSGTGWPKSEFPPRDAQVLSCVVREPDPSANDPGAIYLWLAPGTVTSDGWFAYRAPLGAPLSLAEPYSRELHQACETAKQAMKAGNPVGLRSTNTVRGRFRVYVLPPIEPVRKVKG